MFASSPFVKTPYPSFLSMLGIYSLMPTAGNPCMLLTTILVWIISTGFQIIEVKAATAAASLISRSIFERFSKSTVRKKWILVYMNIEKRIIWAKKRIGHPEIPLFTNISMNILHDYICVLHVYIRLLKNIFVLLFYSLTT